MSADLSAFQGRLLAARPDLAAEHLRGRVSAARYAPGIPLRVTAPLLDLFATAAPGAELATLPEEVLDLPRLPRRLAVIGAGNTGAQLVTIFNAFGSDVTLLEVAPRILVQTDAAVSAAVAQAFTEQGVRVLTSVEQIVSLQRSDDGAGIVLIWRVDDDEESDVFDEVIMCAGWPASVENLGLEVAGVQVERGRRHDSELPVRRPETGAFSSHGHSR